MVWNRITEICKWFAITSKKFVNDVLEKLKRFLFRRQFAYIQVFKKEDQLARTVLQDLAKFCRAFHTTYREDAREHAVLEGRREVWLRITEHLNLTSQELWDLYGRGNEDA